MKNTNIVTVNLMDIQPQHICDWLELHEDCEVRRLSIEYLPSLHDGLVPHCWVANLTFRNPSEPEPYGSASVYFNHSSIRVVNVSAIKATKERAEKAFWATMQAFHERAVKPNDLLAGEAEYVDLPQAWAMQPHKITEG